jgi:hypothetical protein
VGVQAVKAVVRMQRQAVAGALGAASATSSSAAATNDVERQLDRQQREDHVDTEISCPSVYQIEALFAQLAQLSGKDAVTVGIIETASAPGGLISDVFRRSGSTNAATPIDLRPAMRQACRAAIAGNVDSARRTRVRSNPNPKAVPIRMPVFKTICRFAVHFHNRQRDFDSIDANRDRLISLQEFQDGAAALDLHLTQKETIERFGMLDSSKRGCITFDEFGFFCVRTLCGIEDYHNSTLAVESKEHAVVSKPRVESRPKARSAQSTGKPSSRSEAGPIARSLPVHQPQAPQRRQRQRSVGDHMPAASSASTSEETTVVVQTPGIERYVKAVAAYAPPPGRKGLAFERGEIIAVTSPASATGWCRGFLMRDPTHTPLPFPKSYTADVELRRSTSPGRVGVQAVKAVVRMQRQAGAARLADRRTLPEDVPRRQRAPALVQLHAAQSFV